jgi:hypothetical protein
MGIRRGRVIADDWRKIVLLSRDHAPYVLAGLSADVPN